MAVVAFVIGQTPAVRRGLVQNPAGQQDHLLDRPCVVTDEPDAGHGFWMVNKPLPVRREIKFSGVDTVEVRQRAGETKKSLGYFLLPS